MAWEDWLVAMGFRPVVRDQEFLLAPSMLDWLPGDHVVWFLIDVVERMDLTALWERAALRRDGTPARNTAGRAGFDPQMLLTLLIYGYACGERSSRRIERLCHTDIAFRLICAGDIPDHSVIARFRKAHAAAFAELFCEVLQLCRAAGLVTLCTVAIDGSKIAGNASMQANRSEDWLQTEAVKVKTAATKAATEVGDSAGDGGFVELVGQVLAEADDVDAVEDAAHGRSRGDELPPGWNRRHGDRHARIEAALAQIAALKAAKVAEQQAKAAEITRRDVEALARAEQALAGEVSTRVAARQAWEQQWEHATAHPGAPLPCGRVPVSVEESGVVARARARVAKARLRVTDPEAAPQRGGRRTPIPAEGERSRPRRGLTRSQREQRGLRANLTDPDSTLMPTKNGWIQGFNTQFAITDDQIILAVRVSTNPADITSFPTMIEATEQAVAGLAAHDQLGTLLFDTGYTSTATLAAPGPDRLMALGRSGSIHTRARQHPTEGPPPPRASPREQMDHRLRTPEGAKLYQRRGATVEPGIGNFKKIINRYSLRGLAAVTAETDLAAAVHNLLKIYRAAPV